MSDAVDRQRVEEFINDATKIARNRNAPVEDIGRLTTELIESNFPRPAFKDGEVILMHEFQRRFKRAYCRDIEPHWAQWPVMVRIDGRGNLSIQLGKTLAQIKADLGISDTRASSLAPQA